MHSQSRRHRRDKRKLVKVERNLFERDGRYLFICTDRRTGKQLKKTLSATTRADARIEAGALRSRLARGDVALSKITVEELATSFLEREKSELAKLAPRTVELYEERLTRHVVPSLGARKKASEVRPPDLRSMIDKLNRTGLAGSTVRGCCVAASAMFRHGVRDLGAIARNPCRDLERGDLPSGKRRTEPRYLTVAEVESLLTKMSDESRPVAATCFYGALRVSEALVLRWSDVDFDPGVLTVPGTKTEASKATIPLLPALASELRAHRERQARGGFGRIRPSAAIFLTAGGHIPTRRNILRAVKRAAERAGLVQEGQEPVGCHDLRHSMAANAFALGLNDLEVARLLRHASPAVTKAIYAGLTDDGVAALGAKLAALGSAT